MLLRKTMPVARRVLGESADLTFKMRLMYAAALYDDPAATLDDLSEAVTRLEDAQRIARRVLGAAHPLTAAIERTLRDKRAVLCARETPPPGGGRLMVSFRTLLNKRSAATTGAPPARPSAPAPMVKDPRARPLPTGAALLMTRWERGPRPVKS